MPSALIVLHLKSYRHPRLLEYGGPMFLARELSHLGYKIITKLPHRPYTGVGIAVDEKYGIKENLGAYPHTSETSAVMCL